MSTAGSRGDRQLLAQWASDCAERVLPLFEARHPGDDRPRKAVQSARAWVRGEVRVGQARTAAVRAHAAARDAAEVTALLLVVAAALAVPLFGARVLLGRLPIWLTVAVAGGALLFGAAVLGVSV